MLHATSSSDSNTKSRGMQGNNYTRYAGTLEQPQHTQSQSHLAHRDGHFPENVLGNGGLKLLVDSVGDLVHTGIQ